ncbi:REP-associated tyrosine transposase [Silvibacterium bohemicum]|uniref:REP-associated tyrosine transposase n=1 Tax=Silvibacterium bohemicum TaxID=1577686 RepID=UPI000678F2D6
MPRGLTRFYGVSDLHFITCSCYHRQPLLGSSASRDLFLRTLEEARIKHQFQVCGYVVMPEHFHLLIGGPADISPSTALQVVKQRFARKRHETPGTEGQVWQRRFYDFNVRTEHKAAEKLHYMHENPVRRGLVHRPRIGDGAAFISMRGAGRGSVRF